MMAEVAGSRTNRSQNGPFGYSRTELKDIGHQGNLWSPENSKLVLESIETYLKTECGPNGL